MDKLFWGKVFLFLHVMGAIAALGPTLTYRIWTSLAEKADAGTRAFVLRSISALDARLPTPAFIAQAVTGVFLIWLRGWSFFSTGWLVIGVALYIAMVVTAMASSLTALPMMSGLSSENVADAATHSAPSASAVL